MIEDIPRSGEARSLLILRPFLRAVPSELQDAAMVDGASRFRYFALPLGAYTAVKG
jgi:ABC-type glycerol-3-phosphate transport system permease component